MRRANLACGSNWVSTPYVTSPGSTREDGDKLTQLLFDTRWIESMIRYMRSTPACDNPAFLRLLIFLLFLFELECLNWADLLLLYSAWFTIFTASGALVALKDFNWRDEWCPVRKASVLIFSFWLKEAWSTIGRTCKSETLSNKDACCDKLIRKLVHSYAAGGIRVS